MKRLSLLALAALCAGLASCAQDPSTWSREFNPLDTPGIRGEVPVRIGAPNWTRQL